MVISKLEIERGGISYTVDTLRQIRTEQPNATLLLLMGADSLDDLPNWRDPQKICQLAIPLVVDRTGANRSVAQQLGGLVSAERLAEIDKWQLEMPIIDVSSSLVRERIASNQSVDELVPQEVAEYIRDHGLYTGGGD